MSRTTSAGCVSARSSNCDRASDRPPQEQAMNAVLKEHRDSQAFFDSQQLPPDKRGVTFEALFFRQLQLVTTKIHETENIDQIILEASQDICRLFNADRLTVYAVSEDR